MSTNDLSWFSADRRPNLRINRHEVAKFMSVAEMNQTQLAVKIKVSRQYLFRVLKGKDTPTLDLAQRIATALHVKLEEILVVDFG